MQGKDIHTKNLEMKYHCTTVLNQLQTSFYFGGIAQPANTVALEYLPDPDPLTSYDGQQPWGGMPQEGW